MTPQTQEINFLGSLDFYSGASVVPPGKYILSKIQVVMDSGKQGNMKARLGVRVGFLPFDKPQPENEIAHFYSMGSKADQGFAPNATGTGLAKIPGATATTLQENTNWMIFFKSLLDSGLPQGMFSNDVTPIIGTWVSVDQVDEPEERKSYRQSSATASAVAGVAAPGVAGQATQGQQEFRGNSKIPVVTEILEGGSPWEGGGGIPAVAASANGKGKATPIAKAKPAVAAPAPAAPAASADESDYRDIASEAMTNVIMSKPKGLKFAQLKVGTFNALSKSHGDDVAATVVARILDNKEQLDSVLDELGYSVVGTDVKLKA